MAFEIVFAPQADQDLKEIINYLEEVWGEGSMGKFLERLDQMLLSISRNPPKVPHNISIL